MKRYYYIRDRRIEVEEIANVTAVLVALDERKEPKGTTRTFGTTAESTIRGEDEIMSKDTAEAFARANWLFVKPSKEVSRAIEANTRVDNAEEVGKLIQRDNGSIGIATKLINVQLKPELSAEECAVILADMQLEVLNQLKFAKNLYEVNAQGWADALDASVELHDDARFILAEPSFVEHIPQRAAPTDPDYGDQWQWNNTGAGGGTAGADVDIEDAWDHTHGAGIRTAVIDNGFDADHEDLADGVVGESGYFQSGGGGAATFQQGTVVMPGSGHGTFCAGMVGARHNNGHGGCGAASECELMLIACLGDQVGTQTTLARAVGYATDPSNEVAGADPADGADILVCSLGPNGAVWNLTATLELALEDAAVNGRNGRGLAIFWAASNGNNVDVTLDEVVSHADVIAVVRSNRNDQEDNAARGDTVELIAPGVDVYSTTSNDNYTTGTGTSYAAPCAAGCATLALSTNPDLTRDEIRQIMRDTAEQIGGVVYDATGHNDDYGFGRVNANQAVLAAAQRVTLETASVVFNDVPETETTVRAIVWQCFGFESLTFQIVTGPSAPFGILIGSSVTIAAPGITTGEKARLWFRFTGTTAGAVATGTVRVRCVETAEEWDVPLSANTIARPTTAVVLVLDQSGSMDWDAGDGRSRVEVLRESAHVFVEVAEPDTGIGIVRFDHNAYAGMTVTDAGPEIFGAGRAAATAAIAAHNANPAGATSIGDGVEMAGTDLDATSGYDETAMIVLTDGQENASKYIADVTASIDDHVFAIGLGTPEAINPAALNALTNGNNGYVVMTGTLSQDERFLLSKYFLQILAGVTNQQIVVDPDGYLMPPNKQTVTFTLNETDSSADVILLSPAPWAVDFQLITPNGDILKLGALPPGVKFVVGQNTAYFRFTLPVVNTAGKASWAGKWIVLLECERGNFSEYLSSIKNDSKAYKYAVTHGLRYAVEVHARSSLRMTATLHQNDIDLGSVMKLHAHLSEYGIPVEQRARVQAILLDPSGVEQKLTLNEKDAGTFEGDITGNKFGTYRFRIMAAGRTFRGNRFTREQMLTGALYFPKPSEDPDPPVDDDTNDDRPQISKKCAKMIAVFIEVIRSNPRLGKQLSLVLSRKGVKLEDLLKCLQGLIDKKPRPPVIDIPGIFNPGVVVRPGRENDDYSNIVNTLRAIADALDDNESKIVTGVYAQ